MDRQQQGQNFLQERIKDYLSRFKSNDTTLTAETTANQNALDQFLLERAAKELRNARSTENKVRSSVRLAK